MFEPLRKLEHFTELFQSLCDAAMDLEPQPIADNIPSDILEGAHLLILADTAAVRECTEAAKNLANADPIYIPKLMADHHQKVSNYLFIRSMILDGRVSDFGEDSDLNIF